MLEHDQRRNPRFDVQLPCQIWSPFRAFDSLAGLTLNMSRAGLLFSPDLGVEGRVLPEAGHAVRVTLQLPGTELEQARCVECLGRIVRLEDRDNSRRIALEFRRYHFTDRGRSPRRG